MINREILEKIKLWLGKEKILIIKGASQVGKTYLLKEIKEILEANNKKVVYLFADDIDNKPILKSLATLELYLGQYFNFPNEYIYLMIDEFQVLDEAGLLLKNIFDKYKDKIQLIVSGSSALEINKNSEYLTGRAIHFNISRVDFKEYFNFSENVNIKRYEFNNFKELEVFYEIFKSKLELNLGTYLSYGGYPEVLTTQGIVEKEEVLKSIIKTYIDKDIINQLNIENVTGFNNLIKILVGQIGQLVNSNELSNTANISINTLKKYLEILVGTYIIDLVTPYFKNIRSEISKMPKVYILDIGIRNYLLRSFNLGINESGGVMENFVYNTLLAQYDKEYIHFYRTNSGAEIDFVIEDKNNKLILCEVKYRNKVSVPVLVKNFEKRYNNVSKKLIITKDILKKDGEVYFIPVTLLSFVKF
ncbi:MAG: ATP-binding protein [Patescibacteria group bacterium]|nr:ATP-binding protein [Patescibacteria group bacterium]MBU2214413.1 ATP-binding protein [Patescibacteria group bacterium]MBU2250192.1 ATP-binding protein [Patescibacteria group bacterium]